MNQCYDCRWRGEVPGSEHSCCRHPSTKSVMDDPMASLLMLLGKRADRIQADTGLNIIGNQHGIKHGWFQWPYNFDPVWLDNCDGFSAKGKEP